MNKWNKSFSLFTITVATGLCSLSAQSMSVQDYLYDTMHWLAGGSGVTNSLCDGYPESEFRIQSICDLYETKDTISVETLPPASQLRKNSLYLVSQSDNKIDTPYTIPSGTAVIPAPDTTLNLIPRGSGSDQECALCVLKLSEGSHAAGIQLDIPKSSWKPSAKAKGIKSAVYVTGLKAEFSASTITGSQDFQYLIYQQSPSEKGVSLHYNELTLYTNGTQYGLYVENTADTAVTAPKEAIRHVELLGTIIVMSGAPTDPSADQVAVSITNLIPYIGGSQIAFSPLPETTTGARTGLQAIDTVSLWLNSNIFALTIPDGQRANDVQVSCATRLNDRMTLFANGNSFSIMIPTFDNKLSIQSNLEFITRDNFYYSDLDLVLDQDEIANLTSTGGVVLSSVLKLPAICSALDEEMFNKTIPFQPTTILGKSAPANATIVNFEEKFAQCESGNNDDNACSWRDFPGEVAGFSLAGAGVGFLVAIPIFGVCCYRMGRSASLKDYQPIND